MSIKDDFQPYVDGNKLLSPNPQPTNPGRGSDNGPMYTSEFFIMLKKNGMLEDGDCADYVSRINSCLSNTGMLNRAPNDSDQEGPDDYYGVANGCMEMGNTNIPRGFLKALVKYFGFLNNNSPGTMTGEAFLTRQFWLIGSIVASAFPSLKNPLHYLVRLLAFPLFLLTACTLLVSCINAPISDADSRRLSWHLGNCTSKVSLLCWLAFKVWKKRLFKDYPNGMKDVAGIYYQPQGNNPYQKWWRT